MLAAEGFVPIKSAELRDGGRYLLSVGTVYCGRSAAEYLPAREVRARATSSGLVLMPKGARSRAFAVPDVALVKER